jgi:ferredoxin-type protein NapH
MTVRKRRKSILTCAIVSVLLLLLLSTFIMSQHVLDDTRLAASGIWTLYLTVMTFMILRTGRTRPWRSIFFIVFAFSFVFIFISDLIAERGSMQLTRDIVEANNTPLCPVAIPQLILPALVRKLLIFPTQIVSGHYGGFWAIFFMWMVGFLAMGRGWCSWGCFFGGIDEGFSKLLRKPLLNTKKMPPRLRYLPYAVLLVVVVWSFLALEPSYCTWLCPLKLVTEYPAVDNPVAYLQAIIFITLGMGLLVILPVLTKKRMQCGLFCPLGALQSLARPLNPYRVRIDHDACDGCRKCEAACPTFSVVTTKSQRSPANPGASPKRVLTKIDRSCTHCGECIAACPNGAIEYALIGVPRARSFDSDDARPWWKRLLRVPRRVFFEIFEARTLFVLTAVTFGATLSGDFVTRTLAELIGLVVRLISPLFGLGGA